MDERMDLWAAKRIVSLKKVEKTFNRMKKKRKKKEKKRKKKKKKKKKKQTKCFHECLSCFSDFFDKNSECYQTKKK